MCCIHVVLWNRAGLSPKRTTSYWTEPGHDRNTEEKEIRVEEVPANFCTSQ